MNLKNHSNEYCRQLTHFDKVPKTVLAAIAVSALTCGGDQIDKADERVMGEWWALYRAGIVPQKPFGPEPEVNL